MKVLKGSDVKKNDILCQDKYKIPTLLLMEHSGIKVVEEIQHYPKERKFTVIVGKGNNGGDALVVARLLHLKGYAVQVFLTEGNLQGDAQINLEIVKALSIPIYQDFSSLDKLLEEGDIIIDGLFGVGFKGTLEGKLKEIVRKINTSGKYVLCIDIPSGLTADGPMENGEIIKGDKTVTLGLPKENLLLSKGREYTGELVLKDIGIPPKLLAEYQTKTYWLTEDIVKKLLPKRRQDSHKGSYGTGIIVGGSKGMSGAVILAANAALRTGIGLLYTLVDRELVNIIENSSYESITLEIEENLDKIKPYLDKAQTLLIGPGFSTENREELLIYILKKFTGKTIIDGDGLNLLARIKDYSLIRENHILTPHPKEMSRLTGLTLEEILKDPINITREYSKQYGCTIVLKGSTTCIGTKGGEIYLNTTGNNGLATGGSGDVLGGIILGLLAQGLGVEEGANLGVYLHGKAADIIAEEKGYFSLLPRDLPKGLPLAIKTLY
ncbi:NAD(P)H-hydrate epimerase [Anaerobranca californiensis DSM 14826]|uniref:Bifunctional NAD(P)H-hydrate repair enzyme n=1 Tax=Anaerobranca californiensis DSM 14826 TaxID=1120989 RepID=A0A1M6RTT9_9FIRM|nr:bifunctional ADP-dependent NAD(P)H-hydrate dehydratase/NAD(P)H-hydrate epimerase [Anaerobranca californiensis]SHK35922.1 NAD(P)H-hydrate epimerase [Anaerobranca californiensis DSM 14826]